MKIKKINCKDFRVLTSSVILEVKQMFNGKENHSDCSGLLSPDRILTVQEAEKVLNRLKNLANREKMFGLHLDCEADTNTGAELDVCAELDAEFIVNYLSEAFKIFKTKVENEKFRKFYLVNKVLKDTFTFGRYWAPEEEKEFYDSFESQHFLLQDKLFKPSHLGLDNLSDHNIKVALVLYDIKIFDLDDFVLTYKDTALKIITHSQSLKVKNDSRVAYLPKKWDNHLLETVNGFYTGSKDSLSLQEAVDSAVLIEENGK